MLKITSLGLARRSPSRSLNTSGAKAKMTDEQRRVVDCPATDRILVTAEAGTGKTYVLIARVARLIAEERLAPGTNVGILTFSRAAAREIRARASATGGDIRYLRVS